MPKLTLVSHHLCPYVQRAAIALTEKAVPFERISIDRADKPDWFQALSPLGKVPLLEVAEGSRKAIIFESAVILEYLEETQANPLFPNDPVDRARHRAWIAFASSTLDAIARLYNATTDEELDHQAAALNDMFARVEQELGVGPWFGGDSFGLVDAAFGPVFRYFDVFDRVVELGILDGKPRVGAWRVELAGRTSVRDAVDRDYPARLIAFLRGRTSAMSRRLPDSSRQAA